MTSKMVSDHSFFVRHINTNLNEGKEQIVQEGNRYKRLFANELVSSMTRCARARVCVCQYKNFLKEPNHRPVVSMTSDALRSTAARLFKPSLFERRERLERVGPAVSEGFGRSDS